MTMAHEGTEAGPPGAPGVRFGKYELLHRLAVGGMAEIFLARSASLGGVTRRCVIKRVLPELSCDRQFVSMFIDEARITIGLEHPHIVRLFDFGQVDGTYFMAIEYVDGVDLVDVLRLLRREGRLVDPRAAAYVTKCVAEALHHAHVQRDYRGVPLGVVHRDVSPHNVFLSWQGDVKVGDFGIAAAKNRLTQTLAGQVKGKFAYMSPEQATGGLVDARADIWAAGVVLHEMLVGSRLFASENPIVTIGRVCEQSVPLPSALRPEVPGALDDVVMRALERALERRYQSADDMARDLSLFLEGERYGQEQFGAYLRSLEWDEETTTQSGFAAAQPRDPLQPLPSALHRARAQHEDPELKQLVDELHREPDLWTLVAIGERHLALGNVSSALSAFRTAAAVFAHRGLLVQAVCAYHAARDRLPASEVREDLMTLVRLHTEGKRGLAAYLSRVDGDGFWKLLQAVDQQGLGADVDESLMKHPAPLLARLSPTDFARLASAVKVFKVPVGRAVVREGESGSSLFAVGRGRLVVHCLPGAADGAFLGLDDGHDVVDEDPLSARTWHDHDDAEEPRIYLSALADGDFFGEFSFLTGRPRSASVETITECVLLEIDPDAADRVLRGDPAFRGPLLEFYKERVGELMLAKNPVFALLSADERRDLLAKSQLLRLKDGAIVVEEGQVSDHLYFIKHGEVEVYRDERGIPVFINKLREGDFFGEMAALHGTPRTANVRAMGEVELFCIAKGELEAVFAREGRVKQLFEAAAEWRAAETLARVVESRRIFEGV